MLCINQVFPYGENLPKGAPLCFIKDKTFRQTFVINFALASPVRVEVDNLEKLYNKLCLLFRQRPHSAFVVTDKVRKRARLEKEAKLLFLTEGGTFMFYQR